jgi:beta-glucosidase
VRPPKELKGFAKVHLAPGETQTIAIDLDHRAFAYYDPAHKQWVTDSDRFEVLVGASSADIRLRATVEVESSIVLPTTLTRESTVGEWMRDPRGAEVARPTIEAMMAAMGHHGGEEADSAMNQEGLMEMLDGMPLGSILRLAGGGIELPEGVTRRGYVQHLLDQVYGDEA